MDDAAGLEEAREALARERLEELQALARTYRNWSVKELAQALGRQPGRLVPESGMPKIDLVVALANALDWPVEAVVEHLMSPVAGSRAKSGVRESAKDFATLYNASLAKRAERDYTEAVRLAVRAHSAADTSTRCAAALSVESSAHEARGSFVEAARCLREATRLEGVSLPWRLMCEAKLANMLFMQGLSQQALGLASSVIEYSAPACAGTVAREANGSDCTVQLARALAFWVRGNALRGAIPLSNFAGWESLAQSSLGLLQSAASICGDMATGHGVDPAQHMDMAACAEVVSLELEALIDPARAEEIVSRLAEVVSEGGVPAAGAGERKAWAAIALANTAKRFVGNPLARRGMLEVASATLRVHAMATSNWYFAHRHLQLENERRRTLVDNGMAQRALDSTEARLIAGVLGQIPQARAEANAYFELYAGREGGRP